MSSTAAGDSGLEQHDRGSRKRGDGDEVSRTPCGQLVEPPCDERAQARRKRDVPAVHADRAFDQRTTELECEERIPARWSRAPSRAPGRDRLSERRPQSSRWIAPMESGSTGSRVNDAKSRSSSSGVSTGRPRTVARTPTGASSSRRSTKLRMAAELASTHCTSSSASRSGRSRASVSTTEMDRKPEGARLRRRAVGLAQQQCDLESSALKRREQRERVVERRREQVADGREGDSRLGLSRAGRQQTSLVLARSGHRRARASSSRFPDRPRAAMPARPGQRREKRAERPQFLAPADDRCRHRSLRDHVSPGPGAGDDQPAAAGLSAMGAVTVEIVGREELLEQLHAFIGAERGGGPDRARPRGRGRDREVDALAGGDRRRARAGASCSLVPAGGGRARACPRRARRSVRRCSRRRPARNSEKGPGNGAFLVRQAAVERSFYGRSPDGETPGWREEIRTRRTPGRMTNSSGA